jgi:hypothetical protein
MFKKVHELHECSRIMGPATAGLFIRGQKRKPHHYLNLHHNYPYPNHLRSRSQLTTHNSQLAGTATGPAGKKAPPFPAGLVFSQPVGLSLEDAAQLTADFPQPATDDLYILH